MRARELSSFRIPSPGRNASPASGSDTHAGSMKSALGRIGGYAMKFTLEIECDNASFGETENECAEEVSRILRSLEPYWGEGKMRDGNGNTVGNWSFES